MVSVREVVSSGPAAAAAALVQTEVLDGGNLGLELPTIHRL